MKVALVTGAARRGGIGRAIAARLLRDGMAVVLSDLGRPMDTHPATPPRGPRTSMRPWPSSRRSGRSRRAPATCATASRSNRCSSSRPTDSARIDVLVNNAGIAVGLTPVVELSEADWRVNLDVMATGVFLCSRAAARLMVAQGEGGRIVTVSSQAGKAGAPWLAAYCAAKFATIGFTQSLAHELGEHGITVNAVCPGTVLTPLLDVPGGIFEVYPRIAGITREQYERKLLRSIPLGRFETPEDVAAAVGFLVSDDAGYITGEALNVTGGQTMH